MIDQAELPEERVAGDAPVGVHLRGPDVACDAHLAEPAGARDACTLRLPHGEHEGRRVTITSAGRL